MSAAKKITLKSLAEEFEKLKEEVIELRPLKKKVFELEGELKKVNSDRAEELKMLDKRIVDINGKVELLANKLEKNQFDDIEKIELSNFKCKKCGVNFDSKKKLREHFINNHPVEIKCKECGASFEEHWKYERHLKEHDMKKEIKCNKCDQTFYTKWRRRRSLLRCFKILPLFQ